MKKLTRKIYIHGDINNEAFSKFSRHITALENESNKDIIIEISSDGGEAYSALAFFDRINSSPCKITTIALGLVASAATLVFLAGSTRLMGKNAWLMVHEDSLDSEGFTVAEMEKQVKHHRILEEQWCNLFSSYTTIGPKMWENLNKAETYLDAQACLRINLAHRLL